MTKKKLRISEEQFENICFWFHKGCRWSEAAGSSELWNAINNLEDGKGGLNSYDAIMENALREGGIIIERKKARK
jgi:hypothetical protein